MPRFNQYWMLTWLLVQLQQKIGLKLHQNKNSSALIDEDSDGMIFLVSLLGSRVEMAHISIGFRAILLLLLNCPGKRSPIYYLQISIYLPLGHLFLKLYSFRQISSYPMYFLQSSTSEK
ncbi:MAG TPA: hypothetical protein V6D25_23145 [Leptolyngbyaceae cyanobacterium]